MKLLRPAQMGDFEELNRIARQVCALHASWGSGMVVDYPYPKDYFEECLREDKLYVAEHENRLAGYIFFYFWTAGGPAAATRKMVSIDDIGVDETLRNQGIGKRMMADLREFSRERGCAAINLYVDAPNENAIAFYRKCGFAIRNHGMTMNL
jgi:ribosomal protein S18 acetylase RimI-like enzyme